MQPFQYDLRCPAAKKRITHAAVAPRNLEPAITMRSAKTQLQNTIELRTTAPKIAASNHDFEMVLLRLWIGKSPAPKLRKFADKSPSQPGCSHSKTICDAQLQKTIGLRTHPWQQGALKQPLQCDLPRLSWKTKWNYVLNSNAEQLWRSHSNEIWNSQLHNTKRIKKNFARNLPKVKVEDVKTKLSCETSLQKWELKMWKRSFCARLRSKTNSLKLSKWSLNCQLQRAADPRMITITAGTVSQPPRGQASPSIFRGTFWRAKHNISCIRYLSRTHLVRAFPPKVKVEDVKTKLSYKTSLKKWKLKMWKRSFRARLPSKSES